jgi:hypothetical protein
MDSSNSIPVIVGGKDFFDLVHYVLIPFSDCIILAYFEVIGGLGQRHSLEQML